MPKLALMQMLIGARLLLVNVSDADAQCWLLSSLRLQFGFWLETATSNLLDGWRKKTSKLPQIENDCSNGARMTYSIHRTRTHKIA